MRYGLLAILGLAACAASAQDAPRASASRGALADLSLEQLANIIVTSPSRREEPLSRAPASVYVITGEDIRRSGAGSLPEALQLAPNLQVARIDASQYAISARGFNSPIANKLLVLIDGRTVYTPLFSGTFWDAQDVLLEDIERIEVISGPGSTLWGANAVNGVINVITRPAGATQGAFATLAYGNREQHVGARQGAPLDGGGHYRLYAKTLRRDNSSLPGGQPIRDQADRAQAGFRADWGGGRDGLTLQGDLYAAEIDQAPGPRDVDGLNVLARWTRSLGEGAALRLQGYFDRTHRRVPETFRERLDTYDVELQHTLAPLGRHRLLWGLGLRRHEDDIRNSPALAFLPPQRTLNNAHVFVQDEISLAEGLDLTLGAKTERNSYTGSEFLPNVRLAWYAAPTQLIWAAASRAIRAPARLDRDLFAPAEPPFAVAGGPSFRSEVSDVYELGYRAQATPTVSFSVTAFHHAHDHLRTLSPGPDGPQVANELEGRTSGLEAWGTWRPAAWWRVDAGGAVLDHELKPRGAGSDLQQPLGGVSDPDSWAKLRAAFDLGRRRELDFLLRRYEGLDELRVPAYTALDARLSWRPRRELEVSLVLQNVLDDAHVEWAGGAELERAALLRLRLHLP